MKIMINLREFTIIIMGFFIILATDSFVVFDNENQFVMRVSQSIIMISIFWMILNYMKVYSAIDKSLIRLAFVCGFLLLGMVVTSDYSGGYLIKISLFLFGYFFCKFINLDTFVRIYLKCMKYITIFSLIVYFFSKLILKIPLLPIVSNGKVDLYFVGLSNIRVDGQFGFTRNWGPFWEPGVFQVYLIIALILVLFYNKKISKFEVALFTIGIITTFSTAGFISMALVYIAYLATNFKEIQPLKLAISVGLIISILIISFIPELHQMLFAKFDRDSSTSGSFTTRWYSIAGNINAFFNSPLFGVGPNNVNIHINEYLQSKGIYVFFSNTNAIFMNYSMFGAIVGTYYIVKMFLFVNVFKVKWFIKAMLFLVFLISLSVEPFVYSLLFHILIFYGIRIKTSR